MLVLLAVLLLLILLLLLLFLTHGIGQAQIVAGVRVGWIQAKGLLIGLNGPFSILTAEQHVAHIVPRIRFQNRVV